MAGGYDEAGLATAGMAEEIGERFDDPDLVWLAHDDQARALSKLGRLDEGLRLVNELLVVTLSGELSPIVTGIVYCNTIAFCRVAYPGRRASAQWAVVRLTHHGVMVAHLSWSTVPKSCM